MLDRLFPKLYWTVNIGSYSFTFTLTGVIEVLIFAILIYYIIIWIKRTKAWNLMKGGVVLLMIYALSKLLGMNNIAYIFERFVASLLIAVIIIFRPEIRRALEQLGNRNIISDILPAGQENTNSGLSEESIRAIITALEVLGKNCVGALIVIERKIVLDEAIESGIQLDSKISAPLLEQIFEHNTPLHDGAVIIRNNRINAATCYLPLSQNLEISKELGTRHRAGIGISEVSDCIALIASEETGGLSVAVDGRLRRNVTSKYIRELLSGTRTSERSTGLSGRLKKWKERRRREG